MTHLGKIAAVVAFVGVSSCGGSKQEAAQPSGAESPQTASSASDEPKSGASEQSSAGASTAAATNEKKPGGGGGEQWEGEAEAVSKPVERTKEETRTTAVIQKVILDNRQPVRDCYDKVKKDLPDLKGTMTIKFTLDPEGRVKAAELNIPQSTIKSAANANCAIDAIKKMHFPASSRHLDTTVNYPFDFKPDGGGAK